MKPVHAEMQQACAELEASLSKKMPCKAAEPTPQQISDRSKISNNQKPIFVKFRAAIREANRKIAEINRQYVPKEGEALASAIESFNSQSDRLASDLTQGSITWGEYNTRRLESFKKHAELIKLALGT